MADALYTSRVTLENTGSLHRRATLPTGDAVDFGVHGPVMAHYGLAPDRERALPVDYVVAAAAG